MIARNVDAYFIECIITVVIVTHICNALVKRTFMKR